MYRHKKISVIIPCRDEEGGIADLVRTMPSLVDEVVVVDNGSRDKTPENAQKAGAIVVSEHRTDSLGIGYGYAHISGMKKATGDSLFTKVRYYRLYGVLEYGF